MLNDQWNLKALNLGEAWSRNINISVLRIKESTWGEGHSKLLTVLTYICEVEG